MAGVSKNSPGCNCCIGDPPDPPPPPAECCDNCSDSFPGILYTGEFDVTISGFTDSTDCLQCDFINDTFTLQCIGGNGLCIELPDHDTPANLDPVNLPCYWGIGFNDYIGDRYCSSSVTDESTGLTTAKSWAWTGLMLVKYPILTGTTYTDIWRLHLGYSMELNLGEIVLDDEGNPVNRGSFASKCYNFYYEYLPPGHPNQCGLHSGMSWTLYNNIGTINAAYGGETASTSFADWCYSDGGAIVEAVMV